MTEKTQNVIPTQELAQAYLKRINEDVVIELRVKEIATKIDQLIKKIYRVNDEVAFNYTCYFTEKTLVYKLIGGSLSVLLPSLPESCLWNETDLHINLNLMQSDLEESFRNMKKQKETEVVEPPSLWKRIKSWF